MANSAGTAVSCFLTGGAGPVPTLPWWPCDSVLKLQQTGIGMGQAQLEYFLGFSDSRPWLCVMLSMSVLTELSL